MVPASRARFARLTAVNIASNVTVPLAGLVDTAMLGRLPDIRFLAGVALASVLFDYVYWTFGFLRMGTTGTTAQAVGRSDTDEVTRILVRGLWLAAAISAAVLILQLPLRELGFGVLSGSDGVERAGRAYFDARIWGAPATLANFVLVGWLLGRARTGTVLTLTVVANVANIVLNWVFIVRLGLAARGAGLATMASQWAMLALGVLAVTRAHRGPWPRSREVFVRERWVGMFRLNTDILVRTLCLVTVFAVTANLGAVMGTSILAANAILLRLLNVASFAIDGAAFAAETLAGERSGAGDHAGLRRLHRDALVLGEGFAVGFLVVLAVLPGTLVGALTDHDALIAETRRYLAWLYPVVALGAIAYMYDGLFLGLTAGRDLRNSMLSSCAVYAPIAAWAWWIGSNHLLWAALAVFMFARIVTLARRWRRLIERRRPRATPA